MIEKLLLMSLGFCGIFLLWGLFPVVIAKEPYAWDFVLPSIIITIVLTVAHWGLLCWGLGVCSI